MSTLLSAISVTITAANLAEAEKIAHALVEARLAACVTLLPQARSVYHWQGKVEVTDEVMLVAKTRADKFDALVASVRALHSYECPCIVATPLVAGDVDYLAWIDQETA